MNAHALIPLAASIAYIPLFAILIANRPWHSRHKLLFWYLVPAILWSFIDFFFRSDFLLEHKTFLVKIVIWLGILTGVQFFLVVRHFSKVQWFKSHFLYFFPLVLAVLIFLGYAPKGVEITASGLHVSYGIWMLSLVVALLGLALRDLYFLIHRFLNSKDPEERNQIGYLFAAISLFLVFAFASFVPGGGGYPLAHIGNLTNGIILSYVFLKHRLVDVKFITRRGLGWIGSIGIGVSVYLCLYSAVRLVLGVEPKGIMVALATSGAIFVGVIIHLLIGRSNTLVDRIFYRSSYNYRQKLSSFIRYELAGVINLEELGGRLLELLIGSLHSQQGYLLLPDTLSEHFIVRLAYPQNSGNPSLIIRYDSPIVEWLMRKNKYLTTESLGIVPEFGSLWAGERDELNKVKMELFFPMMSRGNLVGILAMGKRKSGNYSLEDIHLVENTVDQVSTSLEKVYLQDQLAKREQELSLINRLTEVMNSSLNITDVYDTFIARLKDVIDINFASIGLIEGNELYCEALSTDVDLPWCAGDRIPIEGTATEFLVNHKKTIVEFDLPKNDRFWTLKEYAQGGIRSIIFLPLLVKGDVIGCLVIASRRPNAYVPEQVHLLEQLTSQIAISVENSQLYARAEQRARVDELTRLFNRRHFDECLKQEIGRHSRYSGTLCLIFLDLDGFKDYNDSAGHIAGDKVLTQVGQLIKRSMRGTDSAFRYGGDEFAIIMPQSAVDNAFMVAERVREIIATELRDKQTGVTASLGLASWPGDGFTPDEIVSAADRALYYAKRTGGNRTSIVSKMLPSLTEQVLSKANGEKETINIIYALAATIEARDRYTYGHSRKVSTYAIALAEALDLSSDRVTIISTASLLHDIGKIGIPDEVLNKPGKLDAQEWELVKSHPKLSATIIGHVPSLTPCLPAILHHQERWDGKGYPAGLKGGAIPIEARILAIADAFDAMTSARPYRGPLSYREAVDELKRCAGSQFDPKLVEVFLPIALSTIPEELEVGQNPSGLKVD